MSELTDNLDKLIQKAALDGALTQDAVAQFHSVVTQCDAQAEELRSLTKIHGEVMGERDEAKRKLKVMLDDANELSTRAAAIEADEQEHCDRKVRLECAELRVTDHQEMFRVVFRNAVIRREVVTPGSASFDQYNTKTDNFPDKTPVEEEQT
jgi:hypothetical protein